VRNIRGSRMAAAREQGTGAPKFGTEAAPLDCMASSRKPCAPAGYWAAPGRGQSGTASIRLVTVVVEIILRS
jgi:hypothetical protein